MAAIAFDSLQYAHQLEAAGMPRAQAEVIAQGLTAMFIHNFDSLVTKDYLGSRFNEFETRIEAKMDKRFADMDTSLNQRFALMDVRFARSNVLLGIILVAVVIPVLQTALDWAG